MTPESWRRTSRGQVWVHNLPQPLTSSMALGKALWPFWFLSSQMVHPVPYRVIDDAEMYVNMACKVTRHMLVIILRKVEGLGLGGQTLGSRLDYQRLGFICLWPEAVEQKY